MILNLLITLRGGGLALLYVTFDCKGIGDGVDEVGKGGISSLLEDWELESLVGTGLVEGTDVSIFPKGT